MWYNPWYSRKLLKADFVEVGTVAVVFVEILVWGLLAWALLGVATAFS